MGKGDNQRSHREAKKPKAAKKPAAGPAAGKPQPEKKPAGKSPSA